MLFPSTRKKSWPEVTISTLGGLNSFNYNCKSWQNAKTSHCPKISLHTGRATTTAPLTGNLHHLAFDDFPNSKFHHLKHTLGCAIEFLLPDLILATFLSIRSMSSELREFILGSNVCIYLRHICSYLYICIYIFCLLHLFHVTLGVAALFYSSSSK